MQKHYDLPGSPNWHARRAGNFNAGDAPAMLGCSALKSRTELLRELHTGLAREFSEYVQERVIDPGHRIEALCRPIAEEILDEELQVLAASLIIAGLSRPLGASLDGLTFMDDATWECKSMNDELRAALPHAGRDSYRHNDGRALPKDKRVQMEQQLLVTGASRGLFSAAKFNKAGDVEEERHAWYYPDDALRAEIIAGWRQFDADLAAYVPTEIKERPPAEVTLALPALVIHAKGEITTSNMEEYGKALAKRLAEVRAIQLITDQDFSNAKESAKLLRENIQQAKHAKEAMLAQTVTVGEAARMIDTWCEDMRVTALKLEQDVEREDKAKKAAMIAAARSAYEAHIEALKRDTGGPWIMLTAPNWPEAIKNKRNFSSMQDALDTMLANAKIAADESARKIRAALACMDEEGNGFEFLLSDRLAHIGKPVEDVRTLVRARITEHKAAEERRAAELAERERARIRAEEEAKLRQEQAAREAEERQQRAAAEESARQSELAAAAAMRSQREAERVVMGRTQEASPAAAPVVVPMPTRAPSAPTAPTLKLGEINARIAPLSIDAAGLASLGFPHAATDKSAKLYRESDFGAICRAMAHRLQSVAQQHEAAA